VSKGTLDRPAYGQLFETADLLDAGVLDYALEGQFPAVEFDELDPLDDLSGKLHPSVFEPIDLLDGLSVCFRNFIGKRHKQDHHDDSYQTRPPQPGAQNASNADDHDREDRRTYQYGHPLLDDSQVVSQQICYLPQLG
jgi:hypothetical protein